MSDIRGDRFGNEADILSARLQSMNRMAPKSPTEALQPEPVPPPPPRSRAVRNPIVVFLNFVLTIAVVGLVVAGGALVIGNYQFNRPSAIDQQQTVTIERGMGLGDIAELLQRNGVIASKWLFVAGVWFNKQQNALKAGEYLIPAHASMRGVMDAMVSGKAILYSISIPEGLTSQQIVDRLKGDEILGGDIAEAPPEGSLLPDTYKFSRGDTRENILARMRRERDRMLTDIWSRRAADLPISSMDELVTLASIVEKETAISDERTRVAAVFINRLRLNMRLQSDPTVIYGLFQGNGRPEGYMLSRADLDTQTPYNTYVIDGLPPGPIVNPGRASLEAVANPSRTRDLFFVADGSGGHAFAETYEDHLRNVARWRSINTDDTGSTDVAAPDASGAEPLALEPTDRPAAAPMPDGGDTPMSLTPPTPPTKPSSQ